MTVPPGRDPWSDPATPTQEGPPYAGPPPTAPPYPPPYGHPQSYGYGFPQPYGGWPAGPRPPWAPPGPQRPGQVVAAAVLAFVQTAIVLVASLYLWFFASVADLATTGVDGAYSSTTVRALATEGTTLAVVQLLTAAALATAGVLALNRRSGAAHRGLFAAHVVQLLLAAYWAVRLGTLADGATGGDPLSALLVFALFFALAPGVAVGLLLTGPGRRWFDGTPKA